MYVCMYVYIRSMFVENRHGIRISGCFVHTSACLVHVSMHVARDMFAYICVCLHIYVYIHRVCVCVLLLLLLMLQRILACMFIGTYASVTFQ